MVLGRRLTFIAALVLLVHNDHPNVGKGGKKGQYRLFTLGERLTGGQLPVVHTVDLRRELREGNRSIFSRKLQELLEDRIRKGEQSILFLNRRGYAGFVSCRACGQVMKCPHCDVSLAEHTNGPG